MIALLLAALFALGPAQAIAAEPPASLPAPWKHWRYFRRVDVSRGDARLAAIDLPLDIYRHARPGLGDLRLIDSAGNSVSFAVRKQWSAEALRVPAAVKREERDGERETWWLADLGDGAPPVSEVRFAAGKADFERQVRVECRPRGGAWQLISARTIYRLDDTADARESLRIVFPESVAPEWRVAILNHADPPLANLQVYFYATPRSLEFRADPARPLLLIYGNALAQHAGDEFARASAGHAAEALPPPSLGPERQNGGWVDPRPWSERHREVLWVALGLAIAVLGILAIGALRNKSGE